MAAVTGAVTAGVGMAVSIGQTIQANQQKKDAQKRADDARAAASKITEENPFEDLQAADVSGIANQEISQGEADAIDAAQDMGEAGAAQVTNIVKAGTDARLKAQEKQAQEVVKRDLTEAGAQSGINQRKTSRDSQLAMMDIQGAQADVAQAQQNVQAGAEGIFANAGGLVQGIGTANAINNPGKSMTAGSNSNSGIFGILSDMTPEQIAAMGGMPAPKKNN